MITTLPAEWDAQSALMLTWPHPETDWRDQLESVEAVYVEIARAASLHQRVLILCPDSSWLERVTHLLEQAGVPRRRLILALVPSNDTWVRDYGPMTVLDAQGRTCLCDFRFNGWGGKYASALDDGVNARLREQGLFPNVAWQRSELVLEGGAIDSDGAGTLLAMHRTLVDPARNPGWSQASIERELRQRLGARHILWLTHGQLSGDDTDGHIDTLARFIDRRTIAHVTCDDPADPDYPAIQRMVEELTALRDPDGAAYHLLPLPCPRPLVDDSGQRLPAGYANFALINGAVLLPTYQDVADAAAQHVLKTAYPKRQVHPIDCRALIRQGGSLHCACMQLPAAVRIRATPPPGRP